MEFLESDCYKGALHICSQGSAILTELLRLSNFIPDVFMLQASGKPGALKYYIGSTMLDN